MRRRLPRHAVLLVWSAGVLAAHAPPSCRSISLQPQPDVRVRGGHLGWLDPLFADPLLAALTGLFAVGLNRAARLEEVALAARFGVDWREYAARTPRWIGIAGRS
jgi:protein-S-isoprenylcysteine O-methyltransferase Ste14